MATCLTDSAIVTIENSKHWTDISDNLIHAHGGGFLKTGGYYYWFGENRQGINKVACYRSKDLKNWEFRRNVLTAESHPDLNHCIIERPKVIYNSRTKKYVMWMHWENGSDYSEAKCAVASCSVVDGEYEYHDSFRPLGHMSRDCTLYKDDDGIAYFVSAARNNADINIYRLSDDYLNIAELVKTLWPGQYREAPALFKRGQYYFMINSACTGWYPNQGKYSYSASIDGDWSPLQNIGSPTTYDSQPMYVLTIQGNESTSYLYFGDRWDPSNYHNSSYICLPIEFTSETSLRINWAGSVAIDMDSGRISASGDADESICRLKNRFTGLYLAPAGEREGICGTVACYNLNYSSEGQKWVIERNEEGYIKIRNFATGKYLEPLDGKIESGIPVVQSECSSHPRQEWELVRVNDDYNKIRNRYTGKVLKIERGQGEILHQAEMSNSANPRTDSQAFLIATVY